MAIDLLKRKLAPLLPEAWALIDAEATRVLRDSLAGRKVVDFEGPHGWKFAAVNTGRVDIFKTPPMADVSAGIRRVMPLVELRTPIRLDIMELDSVARGANDADLSPIVRAAEQVARAEDMAIFHGYPAAGIVGVVEASPHPKVRVSAARDFPRAVVEAKDRLRDAGVNGPFALVLGGKAYDDLFASTEEGYPLVKRIRGSIVEGPIVRALAIDGAVLMSVRGGDYALTIGQDWSLGFADRDRSTVELFLTETFTFRILDRTAAVHLTYG
jgi:uncharacterized linocin/CFP29 family protein